MKREARDASGTTSMVQTAAAISSRGRANCGRSAPGSTRRKARHSSRNTVSAKNGRISAPSGGSAIPSRIEMATRIGAVTPEPGQPRASSLRQKFPWRGITAALAAVDASLTCGADRMPAMNP